MERDRLIELYTELKNLNHEKIENRRQLITLLATILTLEGAECIEVTDGKHKVQLLSEALSEALLGTLKVFLTLYPTVSSKELCQNFHDEMLQHLTGWRPDPANTIDPELN